MINNVYSEVVPLGTKDEIMKLREALLYESLEDDTSKKDTKLEKLQSEGRKQFFTDNLEYTNTLSRQSLCNEIKQIYNEYMQTSEKMQGFIPRHNKYIDGYTTPWFEEKPELLEQEITLMRSHYPDFMLRKTIDGNLCWIGIVKPIIVRKNAEYELRLSYDNYRKPSDDSMLIDVITTDFSINNNMRIWLDRSFNKINRLYSSHAAICITKAIKLLNAYELFLSGYIDEREFDFII